MSGHDDPPPDEPGHETSETWPSSSVTVHMARGAEQRRQSRREDRR